MEPVVFDSQRRMSEPPSMLHRPADAPPASARASDLAQVQNFRRELSAQLQMRRSPRLGSRRATARAWLGRLTGRADRRLLFSLAQALEALVEHCDGLGDRLTSQEAMTADLAAAYGEDLTRLRAEVAHLNRLAGTPEEDMRG